MGNGKTVGFIFDCDGVLLDSMPIWRRVERELVELIGSTLDAHDLGLFYSASTEVLADHFHAKYGERADIQKVIYLTHDLALQYYQDEVMAYPGAVDFVAGLHASGYPLAVVSASPSAYLQAGLDRVGLARYFSEIISVDDLGLTKSDPATYQLACKLLAIDSLGSWGLDDSAFALTAMKSAGLKTIGVYEPLNHTCDYDDILAVADITIRGFSELDFGQFIDGDDR